MACELPPRVVCSDLHLRKVTLKTGTEDRLGGAKQEAGRPLEAVLAA